MPWPTPPSDAALPGTEYDADTDKPSLARAQLLQLKERVDALSTALKAVIDNGEPVLLSRLLASLPAVGGVATLNRGALTQPVSAQPDAWGNLTLNAAASNVFFIQSGGETFNLTLTNPTPGQTINLRFYVIGTHSAVNVSIPGAKISGAPIPGAGRVNWLVLTYVDASHTRWEGSWLTLDA
ncbi:MAG: hypothetical protein HZB72_09240 [Burkholderiales bacterium]|nr:hypothetical protein [Burkholderiales bacterium]